MKALITLLIFLWMRSSANFLLLPNFDEQYCLFRAISHDRQVNMKCVKAFRGKKYLYHILNQICLDQPRIWAYSTEK